jgi:hypothetical protein
MSLLPRRACGSPRAPARRSLPTATGAPSTSAFEGDQIVAAYDWQSLAVGGEPALVGAAGHAFTADWGIPQARRLPTLAESQAFVAEYEAARGARFSQPERETVDAAWVYATAYGARCEHSDAQLGLPWAEAQATDDSYRGLLARHGDELLA